MALEIMRDARVRSVQWKDLCELAPAEVASELLVSLPWLLFTVGALHATMVAHPAWALAALLASFYFFLTGLRQTHNAHHYAIGISRLGCELLMFALSVLMLGSMHAVQINHLYHHKHCMGEDDWEAMSARLTGLQAILLGPYFPYKLHVRAFEIGTTRQKRWVVAELMANVVWIGLVFCVFDWTAMKVFVVLMAVGQCFTAFFAVWTVHHDCDRNTFIGRTVRGRLKAALTYNMFFHVEHHLFPAVPTCHLHELAQRLDQAAPELQQKRVF